MSGLASDFLWCFSRIFSTSTVCLTSRIWIHLLTTSPPWVGWICTSIEQFGYYPQATLARRSDPLTGSRNGDFSWWACPWSGKKTKYLARLYQERWEIELGFRDIKSSMQHNAITLHSMTVELDYQELWGVCYWPTILSGEKRHLQRWPLDVQLRISVSSLYAST